MGSQSRYQSGHTLYSADIQVGYSEIVGVLSEVLEQLTNSALRATPDQHL
jgi:hypothetical protein